MKKMNVMDTDISVVSLNGDDYLCLTDMIKAKDGDFFVSDWLRNRNTLEYLGIWEQVYNPAFNYGEFATIKNQSGLNRFKISVKEFAERTKSIGLIAKAGRYGGLTKQSLAQRASNWLASLTSSSSRLRTASRIGLPDYSNLPKSFQPPWSLPAWQSAMSFCRVCWA